MLSVNPDAALMPSEPSITPTIAVASGIPAATSEPNVTSSTTAATRTPISSLCMPSCSVPSNALPV